MNPRYYHSPPQSTSERVRCPVCREIVYSRAGIHPQCAVRQSDPPRPKPKPKVATDPAVLAGGVVDPTGAEVIAPLAAEPPLLTD